MSEKEKQITEDYIKALSAEELDVVVKCLPDRVLWNELFNRYEANRKIVNGLECLVGKA